MKNDDLANVAKYLHKQKDKIKGKSEFSKGMSQAYQDAIFLVEDMIADPEYPINEILKKQ